MSFRSLFALPARLLSTPTRPTRCAPALLWLLLSFTSLAHAQTEPTTALPETPPAAAAETLIPAAKAHNQLAEADMSPWGMYQKADVLVQSVMLGLLLASVVTWTIWMTKSLELLAARRRLKRGLQALRQAKDLGEAEGNMPSQSAARDLLLDAREELLLSGSARSIEGIKERVSFRLERLVAASGRQMSKGTGVLATIGAIAPFVGLFGTVWGIMNSFIGIARAQTTNLAVVAPGIAEALLATAMGLVAAIPAVVIYNLFARAIASYKAQLTDAAAQVLLLVSRDLDKPATDKLQLVCKVHGA